MTIGLWVIVAALVGAVVVSGRSRTVRMAGCALVFILGCYVALVVMHLLVR